MIGKQANAGIVVGSVLSTGLAIPVVPEHGSIGEDAPEKGVEKVVHAVAQLDGTRVERHSVGALGLGGVLWSPGCVLSRVRVTCIL